MPHNVPISNFLSSALASKHPPDVSTIMSRTCKRFGFLHATLYVMSRGRDGGTNNLFTTYSPEWVKYYFENDYSRLDPIMRRSLHSILPVNWCSVKPKTLAERRIVGESLEHGVGSTGLTAVQRLPSGGISVLTFTSDEQPQHWNRRVKEIAADTVYAACILTDSLRIGNECSALPQPLTSRECEVLQWAARGKSAWETGRILGISRRTVEFHIGNCCEKLNTVSKTQAISKALTQRVISL
ncbi:helix-turn-helix transcriptional regulator [Shinella sumterensis]|uniref:helix-turn-helix transcriptional regulator n=1 Tax=Shinella sumterensis TaxID=1967501 RepID=UPI003F83F55B